MAGEVCRNEMCWDFQVEDGECRIADPPDAPHAYCELALVEETGTDGLLIRILDSPSALLDGDVYSIHVWHAATGASMQMFDATAEYSTTGCPFARLVPPAADS